MAKLKRDHGGYHSSGQWLKYQQPSVVERKPRAGKRKDTNKWCKGKVGTPHTFIQTYHKFLYYGGGYYTTKCTTCGKQVYKKRVKSLPLRILVTGHDQIRRFPVQVKVNGRAIPIDPRRFSPEYCWSCEAWHLY